MAVGLGNNSYIGVGEEAVYGTVVARSRFLLHNSESIKPAEARVESGSLYRVGRHAAQYNQGNVDVGGDFTFQPRYSSQAWMILLKHLLGSIASSQPDVTAAPTVWRHTFTPANALPTGLSIEVAKDVLAHLHAGCKISSVRMRFAAGSLLDATVSVMGQQTTSISASGLSYTEGNLIVCTNATLTWTGNSQSVLDGDLAIENALTQRHYMSARTTSEPLRSGKRRVSGSFRIHLEDAVLYSDFRNATARSLVVTFTGSSIAGGYSYDMQITLPVSILTDAVAPATDPGPLVVPCSFESFVNDAQANEVSIRITNESSAV